MKKFYKDVLYFVIGIMVLIGFYGLICIATGNIKLGLVYIFASMLLIGLICWTGSLKD